MKNLIKLSTTVLLAFLSITFISCDSDDENTQVLSTDITIAENIRTNPDYSMFNEALRLTSTYFTLSQADGTFTLFAPTNEAFQRYLEANSFSTVDEVPLDLLKNVIRNHVINEAISSSALSTGYVKSRGLSSTDDNLDIYVDVSSNVVLNGSSTVISTDLNTLNGVIHTIDEVIELPTVVTLASLNPSFSNLVTAIDQEGLVPTLSSTSSDFTVFAPTNDAFQALIDADPMDSISSFQDILNLPNLTDILTYHVVDGSIIRANDIPELGLDIDPIGPGLFNITEDLIITDATATSINVVLSDVTAINGVIQAVDFVLRPN